MHTPGTKVVTPYGTGFVVREGTFVPESGCDLSCQRPGCECGPSTKVSYVQVELDGGGMAWVSAEQVTDPEKAKD